MVAAFIPFLSVISVPAILIGNAGVLIVVLESVQHLFQFQYNWISYLLTCENFKHEKYLWFAN